MASFGEVLGEFKRSEAPESVFPLINNVTLCNALMAWKSVRVTYKTAHDCQETDELLRWEWLWTQVELDTSMFGVVAGCRAQNAPELLTRLRGLRLIYPDGTINLFAKQYLSQQIIHQLQGKRKPVKETSAPK